MDNELRRVTVEAPGADRFISVSTTVFPDTPDNGARIQISYMGANFGKVEIEEIVERLGRPSVASSRTLNSRKTSFEKVNKYVGYQEGAFFAGYEIAGVINQLGESVPADSGFFPGQNVIIFPFEGMSNVVTEMYVVDDIQYLIPVPKSVPLSVASTLPVGGLIALFTVTTLLRVAGAISMKRSSKVLKILIVGTGGLPLWAITLLFYYIKETKDTKDLDVKIYVCSSSDEGLAFVKREYPSVETIQWLEILPEENLIERIKNVSEGYVDIILNFGTTERNLKRCLDCLNVGGQVFVNEEASEVLMTKFTPIAHANGKHIDAIHAGTIDQLKELMSLVEMEKVHPPPRKIFQLSEASEVLEQLAHNEILGRPLLQFNKIND